MVFTIKKTDKPDVYLIYCSKLDYIKNIHQYVALVIDDNPDLIDGLHHKYPEIMGVKFGKEDDTSKRPFRVSSWGNLLNIIDHIVCNV